MQNVRKKNQFIDGTLRHFCFTGILPCTILIPGLFFVPESPRWLVSFMWYIFSIGRVNLLKQFLSDYFLKQAKMGMTEDFETSLQVLRGFDTDITLEVNEIKVIIADLSTPFLYYS